MDLLYISEIAFNDLKEFCTERLLSAVIIDFQAIGKVIQSDDINQHPTKFWHIEGYINTESKVSLINKLQVILAFIHVGGIVELFGQNFRDITILSALQNEGVISEDELAILNDPWFFYNLDGVKPRLDFIK